MPDKPDKEKFFIFRVGEWHAHPEIPVCFRCDNCYRVYPKAPETMEITPSGRILCGVC